jgi:CheY-like chemotaxis protein
MLGGDIVARSTPGNGSTFVLSVETGPMDGVTMLDDPGEARIERRLPPRKGSARRLRLAGRILLAEDAPDNQRLVSFYLRQAGAQVEAVEDGLTAYQTALAAEASGRGFDLVLMDMQMPRLDGYQATSRLRADGYAKPIIALTAHAMDSDREQCARAGCTDFVAKPIDLDGLVETARKYLGGARDATSVETCWRHPELIAMADEFVAGLPARASALAGALAEGDVQRVVLLSHRLKGTAGSFGFPAVTEAAAEVERLARTSAPRAAVDESLGRLAELCARAATASRRTAGSPHSTGARIAAEP